MRDHSERSAVGVSAHQQRRQRSPPESAQGPQQPSHAQTWLTSPLGLMPQLVMALQCSIVNAATLGVPLGGPRSAMNASRDGCTLPASSVARLCRITGPPSQFHAIRKRVNALLRTGCCRAAWAQLLPPSAETSTLLIRPLPENEMPEIS